MKRFLVDPLEEVKRLHARDVADGGGRVDLPGVLDRYDGEAVRRREETLQDADDLPLLGMDVRNLVGGRQTMRRLEGDLIILGVGGKIGPSLALTASLWSIFALSAEGSDPLLLTACFVAAFVGFAVRSADTVRRAPSVDSVAGIAALARANSGSATSNGPYTK